MLKVIPLPAFKDNYIWLLVNSDNQYCAIVDPGDAAPVLAFLQKNRLLPCAILITHHHQDHCGGIGVLQEKFPALPIYGPAHEAVTGVTHKLVEGDSIKIDALGIEFKIYDVPGHTHGHIAYYGGDRLFCGDTLFAAGCGRLFEGTAQQMYQSLTKIAGLPDNTQVYCAHEYTAANLEFAQTVEPQNEDVQNRIREVTRLRKQQQVTLPSNLRLEKLTNPFLRCERKSVINSVQIQSNKKLVGPISVFQALRAWKDVF